MLQVKDVFITNVFGSSNRGDAALVEVLVQEIKAAFGDTVKIRGFAYEPALQDAHLPEVEWFDAPGRSRQKVKVLKLLENVWFEAAGFVCLVAPPLARAVGMPKSQADGIAALRKSDLVVSCAGGFLHDANISIYFNLCQILFARLMGKPVVMAPQTIGPIQSPVVMAFARFVLSKVQKIFVRERISLEFCVKDLGITETKVDYSPDLALYHGEADYEGGQRALAELKVTGPYISLTALDWEFPDRPDRKRAQEEYIEKLRVAIDLLFERTKLPILILNQVRSDLWVGKQIAKGVKAPVTVDDSERSPQIMRGMISRSEAMIASRFHSCVFALLEATPVRALSYNYKTDGIMQEIGLFDRVENISTFKPESLAEEICSDIDQQATISDLIRERMRAIKEHKFSNSLQDLAKDL